MEQTLINKIISLRDNITFEENYGDYNLTGQLNGENFTCDSKDFNPRRGEIDSRVTIKFNDSDSKITIGNTGSIDAVKSSPTTGLFENIYFDRHIRYTKADRNHQQTEVFARYLIEPRISDYKEDEGGTYVYDGFCQGLGIGYTYTQLSGSEITNISEAAFFKKEFLEQMVSKKFVSKNDVYILQNYGVLYSKYTGENVNVISDKSSPLNPMSALSYTAVYMGKNDFEQGNKPKFVEVNLYTTNESECKKFRKAVYVLDTNGKYQNVSSIAYEINRKYDDIESSIEDNYSPLDYELMMGYINELNIQLTVSQEFKQCYEIARTHESMKPSINKIHFAMNKIKFEKYLETLRKKQYEQMSKKFEINEQQDIRKSI